MVRWSFLSYTRLIVAGCALGVAIFFTISLVTYNVADYSLIYRTSDSSSITNSAGVWGAHTAALLLFFLGSTCFLLIPLLLFIAFSVCTQEILIDFWRRLCGGVVLLVTLPTLCALLHSELYAATYPGGYIGNLMDFILMKVLSPDLVMPFLIIVLLVSCILVVQFTWALPLVTVLKKSCEKLPKIPHKKIVAKKIVPTVDPLEQLVRETLCATTVVEKPFALPSKTLLGAEPVTSTKKNQENLRDKAQVLEEKLECFGILGSVIAIRPGPVVTLFEYQPDIDVKVSKILALEDDLALALQAVSLRIIAPIPGRAVVGFEVANQTRCTVLFSDIVRSSTYSNFSGRLPLILGYDTTGNHIIIDLVQMPHVLVAGSTGSGKSVALNTMLMSLLYHCTPQELKLILIDPKRLEFAAYADIAHLIFPIVTESSRAIIALRWSVEMMEKRYAQMAEVGARNIYDYNTLQLDSMSHIVIIIDELADLMMTTGKDVEDLIARLAQMSRAAGIHLIIATQRPSVDVITGLIKVNFPARIAFKVTSKIDSRTILDCSGADKLLGKGDMLFLDTQGALKRVHGAYVTDQEIQAVVGHIKQQQPCSYTELETTLLSGDTMGDSIADELLYKDVIEFLMQVEEISISLLQRKFRIGYNRSARIIDTLESQGRIITIDGSKMRKVLR